MKHLKITDSMGEFLQKQPRNLTLAKHRLGIHQLRIMARIVEAIQPDMSMEVDHTKDLPGIWVDLNVSELVVNNNVKPLKAAFEGLMKKIVIMLHWLEDKHNWLEIGTTLIQEYKYEYGMKVARVKISGSLLPELIDLARGYTRYKLQVAFTTSSPNTYKLYQYIAHFRDRKVIQCNVDMLRRWLQIEGKYEKPKTIKQRILNPAMEDLKQKADVWFDIADRVTKGRKFVGWKFNIYNRDSKKELKTTQPKVVVEQVPVQLQEPSTIQLKEAEIRQKKLELEMLKSAKAKADYTAKLSSFFKLSDSQIKKLETYQANNPQSVPAIAKLLVLVEEKATSGYINKSVGGYTVDALNKQFDIGL